MITPLILIGGVFLILLLEFLMIHYAKRSQRMSDTAKADLEVIKAQEEAQKKDSDIAADVARERASINKLLS